LSGCPGGTRQIGVFQSNKLLLWGMRRSRNRTNRFRRRRTIVLRILVIYSNDFWSFEVQTGSFRWECLLTRPSYPASRNVRTSVPCALFVRIVISSILTFASIWVFWQRLVQRRSSRR
jgi:hypothetical protein